MLIALGTYSPKTRTISVGWTWNLSNYTTFTRNHHWGRIFVFYLHIQLFIRMAICEAFLFIKMLFSDERPAFMESDQWIISSCITVYSRFCYYIEKFNVIWILQWLWFPLIDCTEGNTCAWPQCISAVKMVTHKLNWPYV